MSKHKKGNKQRAEIPKRGDQKDLAPPRNPYIFVFLVLLLTLIAYLPVFNAGFVNWDDPDYVINNPLIKSFSKIGEILSSTLQGNYHPLTLLSLALNYAISGEEAWSYHVLNLLLHLGNTFLVYKFTLLLCKDQQLIALITSLLFGLHPMHVESVAWVSERKDVLYTLFFLFGMMSYIKFANTGNKKNYLTCFIWFFLSLLSKPAAVVFPLALLLIDYYRNRIFSFDVIREKIPFFLLSLILGYLTLHFQTDSGATEVISTRPFSDRIFYGFYGFMMYCYKLILPLHLSPFYPMPATVNNLPVAYYLSPLFFTAIAVLCLRSLRTQKILSFGFGFYFINVMLVLQFFIVGSAIIADRYSYVSYIGLFLIIASLLSGWFKHSIPKALPYLALLSLLLVYLSYRQATKWTNPASLWDHAIKITPSFKAYNNRALYAREKGDAEIELKCLNEALKYNKNIAGLFSRRGNIYFDKGHMNSAMNDFNTALSISPEDSTALGNRGAIYGMQQQYALALQDFNKLLDVHPTYKPGYKNRGVAFLNTGRYAEAVQDFNKYLEPGFNDPDVLGYVGFCHQQLAQFNLAVEVYNKAIALKPTSDFYLNRSYSWFGTGNLAAARNDALKAVELGGKIPIDHARNLGL